MGVELVDTIVALATPPGVGAIAVVRASGPGARSLVGRVAPPLADRLRPRHAHLTTLVDPTSGSIVDQGILTWFPGPASFTGEDTVEFSGHGGEVASRLVLRAFLEAGARQAEPGEFTRRALANGKLDLVQAEALGDLIEGNAEALHGVALRQLERHLSERVSAMRESLIGLEAILGHHIDFPEEDDAPVPVDEIAGRAEALCADVRRLVASAPEGRRLRSGAVVVLAGRPNAGKSTLFNMLLGEERALVTEVAGTTRDALEADVSFEGYPVRLVDTAGLGDTNDRLEKLGIEVAHRFLEAADLVLHCVAPDDDGQAVAGVERVLSGRPVLRVATKSDLDGAPGGPDGGVVVRVSAHSGEGLEHLRAAVVSRVFGRLRGLDADVPVLLRDRQSECLARAADEIAEFARALRAGVPAEFAATHLKAAESQLEALIGLVDSEAVLDRLFASFCVGK